MSRSPVSLPKPSRSNGWIRKIHIYLGLYFLVFLWLFAVSGLLLNHAWGFTEFWAKRREATSERAITRPPAGSDLRRAKAIMQSLTLVGELEWTTTASTPERLEFRVARPGRIVDVKADLAQGVAVLKETRVNEWGVLRALHTFSGVRGADRRAERDWVLTKVWSFAMDALAAGLVVLVGTSVLLAYGQRDTWVGSAIALGLGMVVCGFFVFGLRWL